MAPARQESKPSAQAAATAEGPRNQGVSVKLQASCESDGEQLPFICPRHRVACECKIGEEDGTIEPLVHSHWVTDAVRSAVMRKLNDCGIRTVSALRRILQTSVWNGKVPRSCWYRGAPPLLNELLNDKGCKMFKTATMETLAARCCTSSNEQRDLDRLLRKLSGNDREVRDSHQVLDDAGVTTVADLRTVLLIPKKELGIKMDLRGALDAILGAGEQGDVHTRKVDALLSLASASDAGMAVVVSCASDSEGEAKQIKERLRATGFCSARDLRLAIFATLAEFHPPEFCCYSEATVLNEILRAKYGQAGMIQEKILRRLATASTLNIVDGGGILFTAPHGIWLQREGHPHHKPEVFTTFIAASVAELTGSSCCTWSNEERNKSEFLGRPDHHNHDPNYAPGSSLKELPWFRALVRHSRRFRGVRAGVLHLDLHGRRDVIHSQAGERDESDCDIGVGAMENMRNCIGDGEVARSLFKELKWRLEAAFEGRDFQVSTNPKLTGFIGGERVPAGEHGSVEGARVYNTMTMQSVLLSMPAVQLELSLRLRRELRHDEQLRARFADAIAAAARSITHLS